MKNSLQESKRRKINILQNIAETNNSKKNFKKLKKIEKYRIYSLRKNRVATIWNLFLAIFWYILAYIWKLHHSILRFSRGKHFKIYVLLYIFEERHLNNENTQQFCSRLKK